MCSFDKIIERIEEIFSLRKEFTVTRPLARSFFYYWYNTALRDYVAASHAGEYRTLLQVLNVTLSRALLCFSEEIEIFVTEAETHKLMSAFNDMEPPTQVSEALDLLLEAEEQWDIWVLSNGDYEGAKQLLHKTNLAAYVGDNILCCDDLRISKPHPKVYSELMRMAVHRTKRIEVVWNGYPLTTLFYLPYIVIEFLHGWVTRF